MMEIKYGVDALQVGKLGKLAHIGGQTSCEIIPPEHAVKRQQIVHKQVFRPPQSQYPLWYNFPTPSNPRLL